MKKILFRFILKYIGPYAFSKILIKSEKSVTYGRYCELVYGRNLSQFNMLDTEQLDKLLELGDFNQDSHILDLGCAVGTISEYISDQTQAKVTGIDYAGGAVKRAAFRTKDKKSRLNFLKMNMNNLKFEDESFSDIISIDTLYFVNNLEKTVADMKKILKSDGRMFIFYGAPGKSEIKLSPENTLLGKALSANNLNFISHDFIESENRILAKAFEVVELLKNDFEKEKKQNIYFSRKREVTNLIEHHKKFPGYRYLYVVSK